MPAGADTAGRASMLHGGHMKGAASLGGAGLASHARFDARTAPDSAACPHSPRAHCRAGDQRDCSHNCTPLQGRHILLLHNGCRRRLAADVVRSGCRLRGWYPLCRTRMPQTSMLRFSRPGCGAAAAWKASRWRSGRVVLTSRLAAAGVWWPHDMSGAGQNERANEHTLREGREGRPSGDSSVNDAAEDEQ